MTKKTFTSSLPFKYRVWSGIGTAKTDEKGKKVYENYLLLPYVDARDVMDHLDEVVWANNRQKEYREVNGKIYCGIWIRDKENYTQPQWVRKRDVGEKTAISADKWEASDAFKRASVCRGIGRFLYSMPPARLSAQEILTNKYNLTEYVKTKYKTEIAERAKKHAQKVEESKYNDAEEIKTPDAPKSMEDMINMDDWSQD